MCSLLGADIVANTGKFGSGFGGKLGCQTNENHEHGDHNKTKDDQLASSRASLAKFGPLHATLTQVLPQLISTELVKDETHKSNAVAESLEECNRVAEKEHRREDEEDVLEHAGEGKNKGRGLANLLQVSICHKECSDAGAYQEHHRDVKQEGNGGVG
jgi:hypothetical protein